MTDIPLAPDDNPPVEADYDTLQGLLAHSLIQDAKMIMHQHNLTMADAAQWLVIATNFINQNDGPLFLHVPAQLEDDED